MSKGCARTTKFDIPEGAINSGGQFDLGEINLNLDGNDNKEVCKT